MKLSKKAKNIKDRLRRAMRKMEAEVGIESSTWGVSWSEPEENYDETTGEYKTTDAKGKFQVDGPVCAVGAYLAEKKTTESDEFEAAAQLLGLTSSQVSDIVDGFDSAVAGKTTYKKVGADLRKLFDRAGYNEAHDQSSRF